jgi:hypothetical protein
MGCDGVYEDTVFSETLYLPVELQGFVSHKTEITFTFALLKWNATSIEYPAYTIYEWFQASTVV